MFKTTSASQQSRARRAVVEATRNETKADFERTEMDIISRHSVLVIEKRQVEEELARLKLSLQFSTVNHPTRRSWMQHRTRLVGRILEIEREVADLKMERQAHVGAKRNPQNYVEAFYRVSKATLPADIMDRLDGATLALLAQNDAEAA